ncbi:MAG: DUF2170 family protein [Sneathiella sp.]
MTKDISSGAERQKKARQKKRDLGLIKIEVWVPSSGRKVIRELEAELNSRNENHDTKDTHLMTKLSAKDIFIQLSATEEVRNGEMAVTTIEGDTPVIQAVMQDVDEFPVMITVGEEQILAIVNLWTVDEIKDGKKEDLNEYLLRLNMPVPLSAFSIINDQYVLYGALSVNSNISEIVEEIATLTNNVIEALESCEEYLRS